MYRSKRNLVALGFLVVAVLACRTPTPSPSLETATPNPTVPSDASSPTSEAPPTPPPDVRGPGFADYPEIPVSLPAAYDGYALPLDLAAVGIHSEIALSDGARGLLTQNGFVVVPAESVSSTAAQVLGPVPVK